MPLDPQLSYQCASKTVHSKNPSGTLVLQIASKLKSGGVGRIVLAVWETRTSPTGQGFIRSFLWRW